jgi:cytochrome c oxidase subunit II
MKSVFNGLASWMLSAAVWAGTGVLSLAHAVTDLPGGPGVNQLNLTQGVTKISADQAWLHWFMLIVCTVVFLAVFAVMFYSIWKHRKSQGYKAANFHESVAVEIAWTLAPFIIVVAMGLMATKTVVAMKDTTNADLTIKATGMQWKWGYDYLKGEGEGIGFVSTLDTEQREMSSNGGPKKGEVVNDYLLKVDNPLVVPVDKKIRIITTANDVIHAFMVPAFGIKQDAVPGFVRDTWFRAEKAGDYYGQCAELCGKEHAYMPTTAPGWQRSRRNWPPSRMTRARSGPSTKSWPAVKKSMPPIAWPAIKPMARAPDRSSPWTVLLWCWTPTRANRSTCC